jgi:DHA1 family tetracycline resistance protein-like MFS transporter
MAWVWLPETVHRAHAGGGAPWHAVRELSHRPGLRLLLAIDFIYWMSFAVYQTTFALFGAHRFGFDATHTGYLLSAFGALGVIVQGGLVGPIARSIGNRPTLVIGLLCTGAGWFGSALTYSVPVFVAMLVPAAFGIGLCNATLIALVSNAASRREQGRVQGAAGALESLGRTLGPVWGNALLQRIGEGAAYGAAAGLLVIAAGLAGRYNPPAREPAKD